MEENVKKRGMWAALFILAMLITACSPAAQAPETAEKTTETATEKAEKEVTEAVTEPLGESVQLTVSAAASLTDAMNELKEIYQGVDPAVEVTYNFGASGALQTQIEEGAGVDVFMSAAKKQMDALIEGGYVDAAEAKELLRNDVVLIQKKDATGVLSSFEDLTKDEVKTVALGEPESVPVGQYSEEILNFFNILEEVKVKTTYGSDVRQVLTWVASGEADAGIVYKTDAILEEEQIQIIAAAPAESHKPVIYPVATLKNSTHPEAAKAFVEFLQGEDAMAVFEKYGFGKVE